MRIKGICRSIAADGYKRWTLHGLYPRAYKKAAAKRPVNPRKVIFLEVREKQLTDSFTQVYRALEAEGGWELVTVCIEEGMRSRSIVRGNCLRAAQILADAAWIFVNDSCYFLSSLPLRPETKVIQLWHACGAFKKFGHSLADKKFGATARQLKRFPVHKNFDYVTVSSPDVRWAYAEAFAMDIAKILPTGISRTDLFYDQNYLKQAKGRVYAYLARHGIQSPQHRKILLYAPTFRGRVADATSPDVLDYGYMHAHLGEDWIFLCKHHPFVKHRPKIDAQCAAYTFDVTEELTIEDLLIAGDVCISDYSSLIFEYSLFERPMLFLAYDLEDYNDWRGFYYSYDQLTPGPVVRTTQEVTDYLEHLEERFDREKVHQFRKTFMSSCDGHATKRILDLMKGMR